jgi:hypothetical protein
MKCGKRVRLRGGYVAEVRQARRVYECFYCRRPIEPGRHYVYESFGGVRRYHVECFNRVIPHRLVVTEVSGELRLCHVLEDDSVL